jgi:hypothetical protein
VKKGIFAIALAALFVASIPSVTLAADADLPIGLRAARHYRVVGEADRAPARLAVPIAILVRRSMAPTGRGAAPLTGQATPTCLYLGWGLLSLSRSMDWWARNLSSSAAYQTTYPILKASPLIGERAYSHRAPTHPFWSAGSSQVLPPVCIRQAHSR